MRSRVILAAGVIGILFFADLSGALAKRRHHQSDEDTQQEQTEKKQSQQQEAPPAQQPEQSTPASQNSAPTPDSQSPAKPQANQIPVALPASPPAAAAAASPASDATPQQPAARTVPYSSFLDDIEKGNVHEAEFQGSIIRAKLYGGQTITTYVPLGEQPVARMLEKNVIVTARSAEEAPTALGIFVNWLPMLLYVAVTWVFITRPLRQISGRLEKLERFTSPSSRSPETTQS